MLRSEIFSSIFYHSTIIDALLKDVLFIMCFVLPSLMLCSKIFSSIFQHQRCYALRSVLQYLLSLMFRSEIISLIFYYCSCYALKYPFFPTFYHHWCYAQPSSFRFANFHPWMLHSKVFSSFFKHSTIAGATHIVFLFADLNFYNHWCFALKSSPQLSDILPSFMLCSKVFSLFFL